MDNRAFNCEQSVTMLLHVGIEEVGTMATTFTLVVIYVILATQQVECLELGAYFMCNLES